jgi:hypothetical protein
MDLFGFSIPLWAIFLIGIVIVVVAWKLVKFALKILVVLVVFFVILMGLDYFQVFDWIQSVLSGIV